MTRNDTDPRTSGAMDQPTGEAFSSTSNPEPVETLRAARDIINRYFAGTSSANQTNRGSEYYRLRQLADEINLHVPLTVADETAQIKTANLALELANMVRTPVDTVMGWFVTMSVISAVRLFMHWGGFAAIPDGEGEMITYSELAARIKTEEVLLVRIAAMLTAARVLDHHARAPNRDGPCLSHTRTSRLLRPGQPLAAMFSVMYTNVAHVSTILPEYFDTYKRREPRGPAHIPTSYLAGRPEQDYFPLLRRDETAMRNFMLAMGISSRRAPVTGIYDMGWVLSQARESARPIIWVDVGGGDGHTVREFLMVYRKDGLRPEQCVVQDLEEVVRTAETQVRQHNDEELKGVRWVPLDFMKQSPVKGALIYYLRHILRDHSDNVVTRILSNVAKAMDRGSRVLISEQLNPGITGPDGPLSLYAAFRDFSMMSIGGKERSLEQFEAVARAAGLRVSAVHRDEVMPNAVVELALKE